MICVHLNKSNIPFALYIRINSLSNERNVTHTSNHEEQQCMVENKVLRLQNLLTPAIFPFDIFYKK